ncbi:aromatic ring-hydroxylating dioxygenase subunit alpha [Kerstersia gyiorum]|uniref:aromatic ring-hydroxylating dioxygenase subunit alpha n=1 Tax=Kerstersia gyiorum TaxID=206506 RepID=UPI00214F7FF2|nr:aromatic ring-hydroxylating dioxygenase subunit alpha [Kerstersia gyiorum]MCR4158923.1 aromatic ring-hydroxylating dioxygenase subunit alpha [Kerstersia gyiorum]
MTMEAQSVVAAAPDAAPGACGTAIRQPGEAGGVSAGKYRNNPAAIRALVRDTEVHKDLYVDPELFELEMRHLFANTWVYVGHASQVPNKGDYYTTTVGTEPVIMVRHTDDSIKVLYNRCPHKGVKIAAEACGNTGKFFRCPYHAWTFRTDGRLLAIPLKKGYENTGFENSEATRGMAPVGAVEVYRDFVFCRLNPEGDDFQSFFGESLSTLDNMVDRSPEGRLEVAGGVVRYMHHCNWKMLVDNQTDTCHPMVAHESSAGTAVKVWNEAPEGTPKPMAVELFAPFMSPYEFFEGMGIRVWQNGHGHTGVADSIHAAYSEIPEYWDRMVAAYGEQRAKEILGDVRHNTVYFPHIMVKGPIQTLRIFKPVAVDKTLVESWTFRLVGAPDKLLERTLMYNRLINAPTSVVGHDDLEMYERAQEGLQSRGRDWMNVGRLYEAGEEDRTNVVTNGTNEMQMRAQFRAWLRYMLADMQGEQA